MTERPEAVGGPVPETNVDPASAAATPHRPVPADLTAAEPAAPFTDQKRRIAEAVQAAADDILELSHRIHAAPEPAFEEVRAAGWIADVLKRNGYEVEHPAGSLPTALRATLAGGQGGGTPRIAILAEYDALPGLGHGCGHNTMAASGVGAAIALAALASELPGRSCSSARPQRSGGAARRS